MWNLDLKKANDRRVMGLGKGASTKRESKKIGRMWQTCESRIMKPTKNHFKKEQWEWGIEGANLIQVHYMNV
jgi:hypothetical protein